MRTPLTTACLLFAALALAPLLALAESDGGSGSSQEPMANPNGQEVRGEPWSSRPKVRATFENERTSTEPNGQEIRGGLRANLEGKAVELPLTGLSVFGDVVGDIATISVEQVFDNPYDVRLEAVYTFPLPEDAAITDMVMVIGERRIRAQLKEREQAQRTYEEARERGQTASLLDQERPNIFTQSVANIEPGNPVRVLITYIEQLPFEDGRYRFAFPMVVGPRYIPGAPVAHAGSGVLHDTDLVADASRITPPILPEGIDAPYQVDFQLNLSAGMPIHDLESRTHQLEVLWHSTREATLTLPENQRTPDRDLVFSYALADNSPAVGLVTHHDDRGGFFTLMIQPPAAVEPDAIRPVELVFVLDTSGSMFGHPLDTSKAVMRHALQHLNPDDTFRVIRFSDDTSALAEHALPNTPDNVARALEYVDGLGGGGGTEMTRGITAALEPPVDGQRLRIVLFLTDGYIGNDEQVVGLVAQRLGDARLFSLGVGSSVNRYLLDELGKMGRGGVHYVDVDEDPTEVVAAFYARIHNPILTDLEIDWGGLTVRDLTPSPVPDVFAGMPLVLTGRYDQPGTGVVTVRGLQGTRRVELPFETTFGSEPEHPAIPFLWARRQVADFTSRAAADYGARDYRDEILAVALEFGLLTRYTSFVAVDERIAANVADPLHTVAVAVNLPHGLSDSRIGVQITPEYVQPGDPELVVWAPPSTVAVSAYFPFGLAQDLELDPYTERWATRFLVPRDVADGQYLILVNLEHADGSTELLEVPFTVDARAPRFDASLDPGDVVTAGELLQVRVTIAPQTELPADTVLGGSVFPDVIKFVRLHLPDGRAVRMRADESGLDFRFSFRHRAKLGSGDFEFLVEAVDVAGNSTFATLRYEVLPGISRVASLAP